MAEIKMKNDMAIKLLHYFITDKGYTPVVLHGAVDEIWLENLDEDYKLIRIASKYLHNNEQLENDIYRTKKIMQRIKRKTLSFKINLYNIYVDLGDSVTLHEEKNIEFAFLNKDSDVKKYKKLTEEFPTIKTKLKHNEKGMELFLKVTKDINKKGNEEAEKVKNIFSPKVPYITTILMALNILIYIFVYYLSISTKGEINLIYPFAYHYPSILNGEYYRLVTSMFLHGGIIHIGFNMYALYIIGGHIENYYGKLKYLAIYFFSGIFGNILSMLFIKDAIGIGASGAVFGLLGAFLYFGYHHRKVLGGTIKNQILPIIAINLLIGFSLSGINNVAHIGGLIGGFMISIAFGVKNKSSKTEKINGAIATILMTALLIYIAFTVK